MGLTNMDYGAQIPSDMALLYFLCAVVITLALFVLLLLIARRYARDKNSYCTEGHC